MGHCSHLGIEERDAVMLLARQHKGVREIARTIGRGRIAIARELSERPPEASVWTVRSSTGGVVRTLSSATATTFS